MLITEQEKYTFRLHLFYTATEGIIAGILLLNELVFLKSLRGSDIQLTFLFQSSMLVFLFAMLANEVLKRFQNRKKTLRMVSFICNAPLLAFLFFPKVDSNGLSSYYHYVFLMVFFIYFLSKIAVSPSVNQYLRGSYNSQHMGTLFSYASTVQKILTIISALFIGFLFDYEVNYYRFIYPLVGLLSFVSVIQVTKIPFVQQYKKPSGSVISSLKYSLKNTFLILKGNKPFFHLEMGFMLYGFAWMSTYAVITIFYQRVLLLNYSSVAFYNNLTSLIAIISLPLFGRLIGKIDPRRFGMISFLSLMLFILFTGVTQYLPFYTTILNVKVFYVLLVAVVFNGLFTGSMPLLWGIGSSYFCKPHQAAEYQSLHLFLTGLRAVFAPFLGLSLYKSMGFSFNFFIGILFLLAATAVLFFSLKRIKI